MGAKINVAEERDSVKISALGEELGVDAREIVAAAKDMAMENAKVPASWVTAGQADRLRAKFGGNKELKAKLERKQHYRETGEVEPEAKKAEPKSHAPKLGKETYERDRRSIFGVVETPGGVKVETSGAKGLHAKPAVTGITKPPPPSTPSAPSTLAAQLPPAKKFIGIQVNPPVRREAGQSDTRFGVVVPAPEPEKPAATDTPVVPVADLWGKLNDGRPAIEMPASSASLKAAEADVPLAEEAQKEVAKVEPQAVAPAPAAEERRVEQAAPSSDSDRMEAAAPGHSFRKEEVPVKWQPKHKAFGAKLKLKHKKHKVHEAASESKAKHKPAHAEPKKHKQPEHSQAHTQHKKASERHAPQREGLLKRLAKKLLGK